MINNFNGRDFSWLMMSHTGCHYRNHQTTKLNQMVNASADNPKRTEGIQWTGYQ